MHLVPGRVELQRWHYHMALIYRRSDGIDMQDITALYLRYCESLLYLPCWYRNQNIIQIFGATDVITSYDKLDAKLKKRLPTVRSFSSSCAIISICIVYFFIF